MCRLLLAGILIITSSICAHAKIKYAEIIWQNEEQFVALVDRESEVNNRLNKPNDHPQLIDENALVTMLAAIGITKKGGRFSVNGDSTEIGIPLFSDDEIEQLAIHIKRAFNSAQPHQDIVFRSHGRRDGFGSVIKLKTVNTGRMFWVNNRLNIIFGEIHGKNKSKVIYDRVQKDTSPRWFGSRSQPSKKIKQTFVHMNGIALHEDNQGLRTDWLEIDYAAINVKNIETIEMPMKKNIEHSEYRMNPSSENYPHQKLKQHKYNEARKADISDSNDNRSVTDADSTNKDGVKLQQGTIKVQKKLEELKYYYDNGLISEALYEEKVRQIIDQHY